MSILCSVFTREKMQFSLFLSWKILQEIDVRLAGMHKMLCFRVEILLLKTFILQVVYRTKLTKYKV